MKTPGNQTCWSVKHPCQGGYFLFFFSFGNDRGFRGWDDSPQSALRTATHVWPIAQLWCMCKLSLYY